MLQDSLLQATSIACSKSTVCQNPFNANCGRGSGPGAARFSARQCSKYGSRIGSLLSHSTRFCDVSFRGHALVVFQSFHPAHGFTSSKQKGALTLRECLRNKPIGGKMDARNLRLAAGMGPLLATLTCSHDFCEFSFASDTTATTKLLSRRVASHTERLAHAVVC